MSLTAGQRKLKGFYLTLAALMILVLFALIKGVHFTGDNIITAMALMASLAGAFFGANFGEHWAKAKQVDGLSKNITITKPAVTKTDG